jgi:hypothetical protein
MYVENQYFGESVLWRISIRKLRKGEVVSTLSLMIMIWRVEVKFLMWKVFEVEGF